MLTTLAVMVWALGPFGSHRESGSMLLSLISLPLISIWAAGPYAVAHKFAQVESASGVWVYVSAQLLLWMLAMGLFFEAFVLSPDQNMDSLFVFAVLPIYQFISILGVYYGFRLWRHINPPS